MEMGGFIKDREDNDFRIGQKTDFSFREEIGKNGV